jgi:hypothetical protein
VRFRRCLCLRIVITVHRFRVQSSIVKVFKIFDFEPNADFIRALGLTEGACTEIESKNMKNCKAINPEP